MDDIFDRFFRALEHFLKTVFEGDDGDKDAQSDAQTQTSARRTTSAIPATKRQIPISGGNGGKQKIAILGGGMSSVVTAFELTNQPGWQDQYDITLYQMGWRLGGKGASGRNMTAFNRIEEHGLHVWGGFYDNAFRAMQKCYDELNRPPGMSIRTWQDAFIGQRYFYLMETHPDGSWQPWSFNLPPRDSLPGNPDNPDEPAPPTSFWAILADVMEMIQQWFEQHEPPANTAQTATPATVADAQPAPLAQLYHPRFPNFGDLLKDVEDRIAQGLEHELDKAFTSDAHYGLHIIEKLLESALHDLEHLGQEALDHIADAILAVLDHIIAYVYDHYIDPVVTKIRHIAILINLLLTMMRGIIGDRLYREPFDSINNLTFDQWLSKHGARDITINSPLLHALHDLIFAFPNGNLSVDNRNVEAGTMLRTSLRVIRYRGYVIYRMAAGMGDIVFAPFYEVLKRRGVKFKFFHKVTHLGIADDGKSIGTITVAKQVNIKDDAEYEPLVTVNTLPCWPSTPLYDQIEEGELLSAQQINLEAKTYDWQDVDTFTLQKGVHFDLVVLGISIGALPEICRDLYNANAAWKAMLDNILTVRTQSMQLWMNKTLPELGWQYPMPMTGCVPDTEMDTWVEMYQLIDKESWPQDSVKSIQYFTGVMSDDAPYDEALNAAKQNALAIVQNIGKLWPDATQPDSQALDWQDLVGSAYTYGAELFYQQYFRANIDPTERYVLTVANSTQYRMQAGQTGYDNLYVTGDWIENRNNLGMIEGANMGGMMTSRAICGYPEQISGEGDFY